MWCGLGGARVVWQPRRSMASRLADDGARPARTVGTVESPNLLAVRNITSESDLSRYVQKKGRVRSRHCRSSDGATPWQLTAVFSPIIGTWPLASVQRLVASACSCGRHRMRECGGLL